MRTVINISLPTKMANFVKKEVKNGKFASTSEFFRQLLREWEDRRIIKELKQSQRDVQRGKVKELKN